MADCKLKAEQTVSGILLAHLEFIVLARFIVLLFDILGRQSAKRVLTFCMCRDAERALAAWRWSATPTLRVNQDGLINRTFLVVVDGAVTAVLQELNTKIFIPEVNEDIEAVTSHLASCGVPTPRLLRTRTEALWHVDEGGGVWRCLTYVAGRTVHTLRGAAGATSAGALVARFHAALIELDWSFRSVRPGAHDTPRHMKLLEQALAVHQGHRLYDRVAPIAEELFSRWLSWGAVPALDGRIIHGDLKISNVRFHGDRAYALVDLDTLACGTLDVEVGDAMRSWCNTASEDGADPVFDLAVFEAAMSGYAEEGGCGVAAPTEAEWAAIVPGIERIALELAARFSCDAFEETLFGWDVRFGSAGDHNVHRAKGQLALAKLVRARRSDAEKAIARARCK